MAGSRYGKYIITDLRTPQKYTVEHEAIYAQWARRILWMDADVVPGAFQMNCSWYLKPNKSQTVAHVHDSDEIIGFFSGNPEKPYDLEAEIEFWIEDEMYIIEKSALIFVPKGIKHCPLILRRVDKPVFHFSVLTGGHYNLSEAR